MSVKKERGRGERCALRVSGWGRGREGWEGTGACAGSKQLLLYLSRASGERGKCARGSDTLLCVGVWVGWVNGGGHALCARGAGEAPLPKL